MNRKERRRERRDITVNRLGDERVSLIQIQQNRKKIRGRDIDGGREVRGGVTPIDASEDKMTRGALHAR